MCSDRSTSVSLLFAFYRHYIDFAFKDAARELRRAVSKPFCGGLEYVFDDESEKKICGGTLANDGSSSGRKECMALTVSGEPADLHSITFVTSNCETYLGYSTAELVGTDLSRLLPKPVGQNHRAVFAPATSTSAFFEWKMPNNLVLVQRNQLLRTVEIIVKLNNQIERGLSFFANCGFPVDGDDKDALFLVVSKNRRILELSETAQSTFRRDSHLRDYSTDLQDSVEAFNRVCNFRDE